MKLDNLRAFPMRAPNVMWFLGAGASASAAVRTASHMIWEFKRRIFCSSNRMPLSACADLSDPAVRSAIQRFCQSLPHAPPEASPEEYAFYFETAFPSEIDRRRFIDQAVSGAAPSFGHLAMAGLMKAGKVSAVWTTNFDRMIEDAAGQVFGTTSRLVVASIDSSKVAYEAMNESRWPLLVKLHGDFQSRRLKNTEEELRSQDAVLQARCYRLANDSVSLWRVTAVEMPQSWRLLRRLSLTVAAIRVGYSGFIVPNRHFFLASRGFWTMLEMLVGRRM